MAVQTYDEMMGSVNVTREEKLVATYFLNGGAGLSAGMAFLIAAIIFATQEILEQIVAPDAGQHEISVARIAEAVDAYRLDD
jgi:hypothetical protein